MKLSILVVVSLIASAGYADWLTDSPFGSTYLKINQQRTSYNQATQFNVVWSEDSKGFWYQIGQVWRHYDCASKSEQDVSSNDVPRTSQRNRPRPPGRGMSVRTAVSPNGEHTLRSDGFNLSLDNTPLTTYGGEASRYQVGAVSWVYGEELGQTEAMGWSPDGTHYWYYEFNNNPVKPFYLVSQPTGFSNGVDVLDYPKAGDPNPSVALYVTELSSMKSQLVSRTFDPERAYIFDIQWSKDSKNLIYQSSDRLHQERRIMSFNPELGTNKTLHREINKQGWIPSNFGIDAWLDDSTALIRTEANGNLNYAKLDIQKGITTLLTTDKADVNRLVKSSKEDLFYMAHSGEFPQDLQLHHWSAKTNTSKRLTDPSIHHQTWVSPNGEWFVDLAQSVEIPKSAALYQGSRKIADLAESEFKKAAIGTHPKRRIPLRSADPQFNIVMTLSFPLDYDSKRRYPVLFDVYNGPETIGVSPNFALTENWSALGLVVASIESRGGLGRGQAFRNAQYQRLGIAEIDDIAAGAQHLIQMGIADPSRIAIQGTSYGGYASTMAIVRHPDLFSVAVACSSVIDWRHYDTIYTERFMGLPQDSKAAYDASSAVTYVKDLKGHLLLFFGMRDDNVHASNSMQFLLACRQQRKDVDVAVGPNDGHAYVGSEPAMKYLYEHLRLGEP